MAPVARFIVMEERAEDRFATCDDVFTFLQRAAELPLVKRLELTTVAISYHPSMRAQVAEALDELRHKLGDTPGILLLHAHQKSVDVPKEPH